MKTFLHYTKEKKLDEQQQLDEILSKVTAGIGGLIKKGREALGSGILGAGQKASDLADKAVTAGESEEERKRFCMKAKSRTIPYYEKKIKEAENAGNVDDQAFFEEALEDLRADMQRNKCSGVARTSPNLMDKLKNVLGKVGGSKPSGGGGGGSTSSTPSGGGASGLKTFSYEAVDNKGILRSGTMQAADSNEVVKAIRALGLFPRNVKEI